MVLSLPSLLLLVFPVGVGAIWLLPRAGWARWVALATAATGLLLSLAILFAFDPARADFQMLERMAWMPSLGVHYLVGLDGISVLFLPIGSLLLVGAVVASWDRVLAAPQLYYSLLLLQAATLLGVFCALDVVLFVAFMSLAILPAYLLLSHCGVGPNAKRVARKYAQLMLAGMLPVLLGLLALVAGHATATGGLAFDLPSLMQGAVPQPLAWAAFLLLLFGFGLRAPIFPLHAWLPALAMEGPTAVLGLSVGLNVGIYGLLRFAVPLAPQVAQELHGLLAGLGVAAVLYGALLALAQSNLRAMLAYVGLAQTGLVLLGIAAFNLQGTQGAVLHLLGLAPTLGGLFLVADFLHKRMGTTELAGLGGLQSTMPRLAGLFLLFALAAIALPVTVGFPAVLLVLVSAIQTHTGAALLALVGLVPLAAGLLLAYRAIFLGRAATPSAGTDLHPRELAMLIALALLILAAGLFPSLVLDLIRPAVELWVARLG